MKLIPVLLAFAGPPALVAACIAAGPGAVTFTDVTATAGIKFVHNSGRAGKKYLPETLGSGAAFVDADNDGWPDILLVNSKDWKPGARRIAARALRNNKNGTFTNVTAGSGLDVEMYGMGVAVGDYDNDGKDDVYITALEGDRLFHNEGNFKFRDVTKPSGIANANFGTSAAWLDYDKDGRIDIFVANYVQWTEKGDIYCTLDGSTKSYCTPESYKGTSSKLYRNLGGGRFADVSQKAGIADPTSKSLGIAILDYDSDGWPDIFVANDTQPNKLYHNSGTARSARRGSRRVSPTARTASRVVRWAPTLATTTGPAARTCSSAIFRTRCWRSITTRARNCSSTRPRRQRSGRTSLLYLAFGVFFLDYDLDGHLDIFAANGHIEEEIGRVQPKVQSKEPPLCSGMPARASTST